MEDIPGSALAEGIQWQWETFRQYLDALAAKPLALDVGGPRCRMARCASRHGRARRARRLGGDARRHRRHGRSCCEALAAGAFGFSTSRTLIHRGADGKLVPGTFAGRDEVFGIGRVLGEEPGTACSR